MRRAGGGFRDVSDNEDRIPLLIPRARRVGVGESVQNCGHWRRVNAIIRELDGDLGDSEWELFIRPIQFVGRKGFISMYFVGPFPECTGHDYLLVVICRLTSLDYLIPTATTAKATEVAWLFLKLAWVA